VSKDVRDVLYCPYLRVSHPAENTRFVRFFRDFEKLACTTADSKALTSSVFVTAESKGLIVPQVGVSVAKFGSADYKGLTTLGGIRRTTTTSRRHYSYDTYYAWAALTCQDISVTIKVSKT